MKHPTRSTLLPLSVISALALFAASAQAQSDIAFRDHDWMSSGLTPLVLLLGLGIGVAMIAAAIVATTIARRDRFDPSGGAV